jgi:Holliday junction resolvase-like predicted endonuclease
MGDLAEYYAVTWLWDQGYEVFRNCGCDGPVDLIVMDGHGKMFLVDVKTKWDTERPDQAHGAVRTDHQVNIGVQILLFDRHTRKCEWVKHRDATTFDRYRDQQHPQLDLASSDAGC